MSKEPEYLYHVKYSISGCFQPSPKYHDTRYFVEQNMTFEEAKQFIEMLRQRDDDTEFISVSKSLNAELDF